MYVCVLLRVDSCSPPCKVAGVGGWLILALALEKGCFTEPSLSFEGDTLFLSVTDPIYFFF